MDEQQKARLSKAYKAQRKRARQREIGWLFTWEQWFSFWKKGGRWKKRGTGRDDLVMSRKGDKGPYCPSNVVCQTQRNNGLEAAAKRARET
ncbi:hypothetical protein [Qipengyuania sp. R86523]|uniref:hypothetical protein n=1 Tax=Qipengyuania sp. R86523 TaxID=3093862 RepID=UPI0037C68EF9